MVSTGKDPLPVGMIVGEAFRLPPATPLVPSRLFRADPGASSMRSRPNACKAVGFLRGFWDMLPPGRCAGAEDVNGELGTLENNLSFHDTTNNSL